MLYSVQKRGGVWSVSANEVQVTFENYIDAVDTAQGAAEVFRRSSRIMSAPSAMPPQE